jgi:cyclase
MLISIILLLINQLATGSDEGILVTKINDSMYKLYVSDYVYMYTFSGPDGTLLIDTGYQVDEKTLKQKLIELGTADVKYIVNTHSNADHIGGNQYFRNSIIIAHKNCREYLLAKPEFPKEGLPSLTFSDQLTLRFNSEEIRMIAMPGGHTSDDIILYFVNQNIVFLGDIIVADSFPVIWLDYYEGVGVEKLVANLDRIIRMFPDDATFISSHGRDYTKNDLKEYYRMVTETVSIVKEAIDEGKTPEQILKDDILKDYRFYDNERFEFINADFWIETIYKDYTKKAE